MHGEIFGWQLNGVNIIADHDQLGCSDIKPRPAEPMVTCFEQMTVSAVGELAVKFFAATDPEGYGMEKKTGNPPSKRSTRLRATRSRTCLCCRAWRTASHRIWRMFGRQPKRPDYHPAKQPSARRGRMSAPET